MKPITLTALGEALVLVTTPGILEWQNHGVLMLTNRHQNNSLCGQRAQMLHLEPATLPPRHQHQSYPQEGITSQPA